MGREPAATATLEYVTRASLVCLFMYVYLHHAIRDGRHPTDFGASRGTPCPRVATWRCRLRASARCRDPRTAASQQYIALLKT